MRLKHFFRNPKFTTGDLSCRGCRKGARNSNMGPFFLFLLLLLLVSPSHRSVLGFEEVVDGPLHPEAMMGSFVPVRSLSDGDDGHVVSAAMDDREMLEYINRRLSGVPRVLYSEQAERRYQEIMGRMAKSTPHNFIGGVGTAGVGGAERRSETAVTSQTTADSSGGGNRNLDYSVKSDQAPIMRKDMVITSSDADMATGQSAGMRRKIKADGSSMRRGMPAYYDRAMYEKRMRGRTTQMADKTGTRETDAMRTTPTMMYPDPDLAYPYMDEMGRRPGQDKMEARPRRIVGQRKSPRIRRPRLRVVDVESREPTMAKNDPNMSMAKTALLEEPRTLPGGPKVVNSPFLMRGKDEKEEEEQVARVAQEMMKRVPPSNIQDIIRFQEEEEEETKKKVKRKDDNVLGIRVTSAEPLPIMRKRTKKHESTTRRKKKKTPPKLLLVKSGAKTSSSSPHYQRNQVYEFKIDGAPAGDLQTIEVEASVPLELADVMELINEGFFGGSGSGVGEPAVRIDLEERS